MKQTFFLLLLSFNALSQTEEQSNQKMEVIANEAESDVQHFYPFTKVYTDGDITIMTYLEGQEVYDQFNPVFQKYTLAGSGQNWEAVIVQLLKKENKALLKHLKFRSETGGFYVDVDSGEAANRFLEIICPYFKDAETFELTLKSIDRSKLLR